jgi:Prophage minor tail protein Z (GPZ)
VVEITVKDNIDELLKELSIFNKQVIEQATVRTLNEAARTVQGRAAKAIAKDIGTAQKNVTRRIHVKPARSNKLVSTVYPEQPFSFRLAHFKPRQTKAGVSVAAWGKRKIYPHTFLAQVKAGDREIEGVFVRKTKARLPIKQLWGPSIPKTFATDHITKQMESIARERFSTRMEHNLKHYEQRRIAKRHIRFGDKALNGM